MSAVPSNDPGGSGSIMRLFLAWIATVAGSITLQEWMIVITIVYTLLQVFILLRDKVFKRRREKEHSEWS